MTAESDDHIYILYAQICASQIIFTNMCNHIRMNTQSKRKYGEFFKYQREQAGLSQLQLAQKIGTSHQNISRWENGDVLPSIDHCVKLADFYGITLDELVGRDIK